MLRWPVNPARLIEGLRTRTHYREGKKWTRSGGMIRARAGAGKNTKSVADRGPSRNHGPGLDRTQPRRKGCPRLKRPKLIYKYPSTIKSGRFPASDSSLTLTPENPSGSPGAYRATFALHRPGYPLDTGQNAFAAELLEGDSYLKLKDSANLKVEVRMGRSSSAPLHAITSRNSRGFVAKFETDPFQARDLADARRIAFRTIAPLLSLWSIECNIPMSIYRTDVIEQATSSRSTDVVAPFPELEFNPSAPPADGVGLKFRGYAKLYRESLNCNSLAFTFLCLYRILEGLSADRKRRVRAAKKGGQAARSRRVWVVPSTERQFVPWLNALYRARIDWKTGMMGSMFPLEARGMKITDVADEFLKPRRDGIAHAFIGKAGGDGWEESLEYHDDIEKWLPLSQMIVRRMLKDEFPTEFLVGLTDDGLDDLCKAPS